MRIKYFMVSMIVVSMVLLTSAAFAHEWQNKDYQGSEGWGMGHPYLKMLDPKAPVQTFSGEVIKVETVTPMKGMSPGVHVILLSGKETVDVHLGPTWFIERLDTPILKGDKIEVKGSMVVMTVEEKPEEKRAMHVLLASEVKKGDKVLILRDATGEPVWAGWKKIEEKK